jgi:hypothetical protein
VWNASRVQPGIILISGFGSGRRISGSYFASTDRWPWRRVLAAAQTALLSGLPGAAQAEKAGTDIAKQVSITSLPLIIMERDSLIEKHAREAGLPEVKVRWLNCGLDVPVENASARPVVAGRDPALQQHRTHPRAGAWPAPRSPAYLIRRQCSGRVSSARRGIARKPALLTPSPEGVRLNRHAHHFDAAALHLTLHPLGGVAPCLILRR